MKEGKQERLFTKIKEKLRDKTRDELCADLCAIGVDARMAERVRLEERVAVGERGKSLGLIEIRNSPIHSVNVVMQRPPPIIGGSLTYRNVYLVPDPTISKSGHLESVRVKSVPVFGKVLGIRWEGDAQSNLIRQLDEDVLLSETLIKLKEDIDIWSYLEHGCWAISSGRFESSGRTERQPAPSREQWECYETIACHLLESSEK